MKSKNRIGKAKWDAEKEFFIFSENFQKQHKVKKAELSWWIRGKLAANPDQLIVEHFYISYFVWLFLTNIRILYLMDELMNFANTVILFQWLHSVKVFFSWESFMSSHIEVGNVDGGNVAGKNINISNYFGNQSQSASDQIKEKESVEKRG